MEHRIHGVGNHSGSAPDSPCAVERKESHCVAVFCSPVSASVRRERDLAISRFVIFMTKTGLARYDVGSPDVGAAPPLHPRPHTTHHPRFFLSSPPPAVGPPPRCSLPANDPRSCAWAQNKIDITIKNLSIPFFFVSRHKQRPKCLSSCWRGSPAAPQSFPPAVPYLRQAGRGPARGAPAEDNADDDDMASPLTIVMGRQGGIHKG
eukprot:gene24208-biopygen19402